MKRILLGLFAFSLIVVLAGCGSGKKGPELEKFSDQELLELAQKQYIAGNATAAVQTCNRLLVHYPTSNLHIETQLLMSKAYGALDQYEEQMNLLLRLLRENIIPGYSPQIYIQIGKFYERAALFNPGIITSDTTDYRMAIDYYEKATSYPDSEDDIARSEALFRRALVEAKIGEINKAVESYKTVINRYPQSEFSLLAQVKLQNPRNVDELKLDKTSIAQYRDMLDAPEVQAEEASPTEAAVPDREEAGSMNNLIEQTLEKPSTGEDAGEAEEPATPAEETPGEMQENPATPETDPFSMPEDESTAVPDTGATETFPDTSSAP